MTERGKCILRGRISGGVFLILALTVFLSLILYPEAAIKNAATGLRLCSTTVIPSLFPFMVLSSLLIELGFADILSRIFGGISRRLFGISGKGAAAPLMGAVCGFPVGAITADRLFENGDIGKSEYERLLTFSNNPSSAFLISAVGNVLWSDQRIGIALYVIELITALIVGILLNLLFPLRLSECENTAYKKKSFGIRTFTKTVSDSSLSMLSVCAFVMFFASFMGAVEIMLSSFNISPFIRALLYGFFEMTGACGKAAELSTGAGLMLTAIICGWSGLSVHLQVISTSHVKGASFTPYFISKLLQGILSAFFMLIYLELFGTSASPSSVKTILFLSEKNSTAFTVALNAVPVISLLSFLWEQAHARISSLRGGVRTK